jgi:hypothetical protein
MGIVSAKHHTLVLYANSLQIVSNTSDELVHHEVFQLVYIMAQNLTFRKKEKQSSGYLQMNQTEHTGYGQTSQFLNS